MSTSPLSPLAELRRATFRPAAAALAAIALAAATPCQVQVSLGARKDNTLYENPAGLLSNGAGPGFFAGRVGLAGGGLIRRGVIAFDLSGIPACSRIVSARLTLNAAQTIVASTNVALHVVRADWGEGTSVGAGIGGGQGGPSTAGDATWIHRFFPNTNWTTAGGDFVAAASASATVTGLGPVSWGSTQLTADVQAWVDDPSRNFGWLLQGDESQMGTAVRFETKESTTAANRPLLAVSYLPPVNAAVAAVGAGCTGLNGRVFTLGATGVPRVGNAAFTLDYSNGPPGQPAIADFALGLAAVPIPLAPGCFILIDPFTFLGGFGGGALNGVGAGSLSIPVPDSCSLVGLRLAVQGVAIEPGGALGFLLSNALVLTVGV